MDPPLLKKPELMGGRFDEVSMKVDEENVEPGEVNPLPDEEQAVEKDPPSPGLRRHNTVQLDCNDLKDSQ